MHAAASYGHIELLEYLVSKGGDVNVTDEDGDTPIYTAESLEVAKWLIDHGAVVDRVNTEGISPAQHLEDEFPVIAEFLRTGKVSERQDTELSEFAKQQVTEHLTEEMMQSVADIMERAEKDGRDPEEELAELVRRTVLQSLGAGAQLSDEQAATSHKGDAEKDDIPVKRQRREDEQ